MSKNKYICLIKDDVDIEYSIGHSITTNLKVLKELQKLLIAEDVICKIYQIREIK